MESLGALARRGVRLLAVRTAVAQALSMIRMLILARLLAPAVFGEFAFAVALQAGFAVFTEIGVRTLVIQRPDVDDDVLGAAWGLEILRAFTLGAALVLAAPWVAEHAGFPGLAPLVFTLAATLVVGAFDNPMSIMAERAVDLKAIATLETVQQAVELLFAIALASTYPTSLSLAMSLLAARLLTVALSYRVFPRPPRPRFDRGELGRFWRQGKYVLLVCLGTFVTGQADDLIVGGLVGSALLGAYYAAYRIATLPVNLVGLGRRVLLPAFARVQDDHERLGRAFARAVHLQLAFLVPCSLGIVFFADAIVHLTLGSAWESSVPILRALSLVCFARGLAHVAVTLLAAKGRFADDARAKWLEVAVFLPAVWLGTARFGPLGAALGAGLSYTAAAALRVFSASLLAPGAVRWGRAIAAEGLWCAPGVLASEGATRLLGLGPVWGMSIFCVTWAVVTVSCRRGIVAEALAIAGVSKGGVGPR